MSGVRAGRNAGRTMIAVVGIVALAAVATLASARSGSAAATASAAAAPAAGVDPRSGGLEVALGEWSLGIEAKAVRPGVVTFVVTNRGKLVHGFEIERRGGDDDEDEDKFETDDLRPGQSERMTVRLVPGVYEIECSVGDHDDRGMIGTLTVRADAPLLAPPAPSANSVAIRNFAYRPAVLRTKAGATVKWRNADAAPHTVTGKSFGSKVMNRSGVYTRRFTTKGSFTYICALHPQMKATVVVR